MLANERTRPPTNIVKPLTWRAGCPARIETGPPAGFLKLQKSGAGRWHLELDRGLFLDVKFASPLATFIPQTWWAARWEA